MENPRKRVRDAEEEEEEAVDPRFGRDTLDEADWWHILWECGVEHCAEARLVAPEFEAERYLLERVRDGQLSAEHVEAHVQRFLQQRQRYVQRLQQLIRTHWEVDFRWFWRHARYAHALDGGITVQRRGHRYNKTWQRVRDVTDEAVTLQHEYTRAGPQHLLSRSGSECTMLVRKEDYPADPWATLTVCTLGHEHRGQLQVDMPRLQQWVRLADLLHDRLLPELVQLVLSYCSWSYGDTCAVQRCALYA